MTPPTIVRAAMARGLAMIAICDHNSAGNVAAVREAAGNDIAVIAGVEITTAEEVHVIGLFRKVEAACAVSEKIRESLPRLKNVSRASGRQQLMDSQGRVLREEARMLSAASSFGLGDAVRMIKGYEGIAVAAHVDRPSFSVLSQLGVFPESVGFDAIETTVTAAPSSSAEFASLGLPIIASSDAHYPSDVGTRWTSFSMLDCSFGEFGLALRDAMGRRCCGA
jgi:predicted metal-dependent phosphoesterase TrpH